MKRITFVLLISAFFAARAFAQLSITGEVKTGIIQETTEDGINPAKTRTKAGSKDDAGGGAGRFRMNVDYSIPEHHIGFKFRINLQDWAKPHEDMWSYFFGYGNFFNDQLTISFGKLGSSPWGTGGPDMWKELEQVGTTGGMRFEYKPYFAPGLNVGFVINDFDQVIDQYPVSEPITILDILQESIIGASYTHDYFHIRAAYRFDSEVDRSRSLSFPGKEGGNGGGQLVYRVEEHILKNYLPGFKLWALGYYYGIGSDELNKDEFTATNWFFIEYAPQLFTAQLRTGLEVIAKRTVFNLRPAFYLNLFDNLLNVGVQYLFAQDYGPDEGDLGKVFPGSPYYYMELEPKIQVNFAPGVYAAIVYNWRKEYMRRTPQHEDFEGNLVIEPTKQTQWINFRIGMYF
jgi:hypothetical protein